ncbi:MAG: hypothetical protein ACK55Z_23070 [bacterium]|jgi:hypothetical protein
MIVRPVIAVVPRQEQNINIGDKFETYGSGNTIGIASQNNGANKNINFENGFKAMGNGNSI